MHTMLLYIQDIVTVMGMYNVMTYIHKSADTPTRARALSLNGDQEWGTSVQAYLAPREAPAPPGLPAGSLGSPCGGRLWGEAAELLSGASAAATAAASAVVLGCTGLPLWYLSTSGF